MQDKFAGGDPEYIRMTRYGTTEKLAAQAHLHGPRCRNGGL
jgi:hypothetical protein